MNGTVSVLILISSKAYIDPRISMANSAEVLILSKCLVVLDRLGCMIFLRSLGVRRLSVYLLAYTALLVWLLFCQKVISSMYVFEA